MNNLIAHLLGMLMLVLLAVAAATGVVILISAIACWIEDK